MAGLRCLKHLRRVDPVRGCFAALAGSRRIWLKMFLLKPGPLEPLSSGQRRPGASGHWSQVRSFGGGPPPLRNPGTALQGRHASHQTDSLRHHPRPPPAPGPQQGGFLPLWLCAAHHHSRAAGSGSGASSRWLTLTAHPSSASPAPAHASTMSFVPLDLFPASSPWEPLSPHGQRCSPCSSGPALSSHR